MGLAAAPPPYPRTPYLFEPGASRPDLVVPENDRAMWLSERVVVEEKLDGANVAVWLDQHGRFQAVGRGGLGAMDRAGQLGRLRAWSEVRWEQLTELLGGDLAAYGEWLWLEHSVPYDRLPDLFVVLDLWSPACGFLSVAERDDRAEAQGLVRPPRLFEGVLGSRDRLESLFRRSAFGSAAAEGLFLRRSPMHRCKVLAPGFRRKPDREWLRARLHNRVTAWPERGVDA